MTGGGEAGTRPPDPWHVAMLSSLGQEVDSEGSRRWFWATTSDEVSWSC